VPDADARRALLLILAVLERHSRALRALLAQVGSPELDGVLAALERRERALRGRLGSSGPGRCRRRGRRPAPIGAARAPPM
jgi:hypothetical protein